MVKSKKWVLAASFEGEPKASNFRLEEEELSAPKDGEILCEALYLSVDPFMRVHTFPVGSVMFGEQVARVTQSKNKEYPVGCLVQMYSGWQSHTLVNLKTAPQLLMMKKVPDVGKREPSVALGAIGMTGLTAYFGIMEICQLKEGEIFVVNGAAGAVGSIAGQIAKIKGCKVIGFAGSKEKCEYVKSLGFDHVFNYKETGVDEALKHAAPDGVDCYFDNVGGEFTSKMFEHMKLQGRIAACGSISTYNLAEQPKLPFPLVAIMGKQLRVQGFNILTFLTRYPEGQKQLLKWIDEGKIKYKETIREGFDKMPQTFMALLKGENTGKMIVKF